jgi:hypothetical protein
MLVAADPLAPAAEGAPDILILPFPAVAVPSSAGPWRSLRGGEIDSRIEIDLRLRRSAEGGLAVDLRSAFRAPCP